MQGILIPNPSENCAEYIQIFGKQKVICEVYENA